MATASRFRLRFWFVVAIACTITLCPAARSQESDADKGITPTKVAQAINQVRASGAGEDILLRALGIGGALLRVGRFSEAADLFSALAEKKPHDAAILYGQALATFNSGRVTEAEGIARQAIDEAHANEPGTDANHAQRAADALVLLAVILAVRGDDAAALKTVQQAVRIAPNHFDAQLALGRALFGMGDNDGAIRAFRAARSLQSANAQALFFLATALERSGDIKGALSTFRELIASNPDMFEGHLGLGVLLLKRGEAEAEEGLKELERALQINPNLYEARVTLGRALIVRGRWNDSVEHLLRATTLAPDNPEPHYQLSIAYRKLGRKDEAEKEAAVVKRIHESRRGKRLSLAVAP